MASLPEDVIIINILTRLPIKSFSRFRCVCKSWSNLFADPNFVKLQLNHSPGILIDCSNTNICYVDYDSVSSRVSNEVIKIDYPVEYTKLDISGVCNGLISYITENKDIIIWNPFTGGYKKLPNPPESTGLNTNDPTIQRGFGYDSKTEDYKYAMVVSSRSKEYSELNVYSFRANSWKTMVNIPFECRFDKLVLFNGSFHWVGIPSHSSGLPKFVIVSFDLETEILQEIQIPQELLDNRKVTLIDLYLLEDRLCLEGSMYGIGVEVWMMKEYGIKESWTKMFTIDGGKFDLLFKGMYLKNSPGNGVILVEADRVPYLYNLYKEEARRLEIDGIPGRFHTWAFLGSLVSPTSVTSLGTQ